MNAWNESLNEQFSRLVWMNSEYKLGFRKDDFPQIPSRLPEMSDEEFLLLTFFLAGKKNGVDLKRTFETTWSAIAPPDGYVKRREEIKLSRLRAAPGVGTYKPGIRWVVCNPSTHRGIPSKGVLSLHLSESTRPAGPEVLMAAMLVPGWIESLGDSTVLMSGLQQFWPDAGQWSLVPYIRSVGNASTGRGLLLSSRVASAPSDAIVSPMVRELS